MVEVPSKREGETPRARELPVPITLKAMLSYAGAVAARRMRPSSEAAANGTLMAREGASLAHLSTAVQMLLRLFLALSLKRVILRQPRRRDGLSLRQGLRIEIRAPRLRAYTRECNPSIRRHSAPRRRTSGSKAWCVPDNSFAVRRALRFSGHELFISRQAPPSKGPTRED